MKELKRKVFRVLLLILSFFSLAIIVISNVQTYRQEYHETVSKFSGMNISADERPSEKNDASQRNKDIPDDAPSENDITGENDIAGENGIADENVRFADSVVYSVKLYESNEIAGVVNHSEDKTSDEEISKIALEIISDGNEGVNVGNLYTADYSYCFYSGQYIIIIDNSMVKEKLVNQLIVSLVLLLAIEAVIVFASKRVTIWITKPVEESFEKQKQFIADASHELKTPLSVIMASSDALEREPNEKKWLLNIKSEAERMNKLIKNLLDLARTQQEAETAPSEDCDISKAVETSLLAFEGVMFEKNISLDYDIEKGVVRKADTDGIKQLTAILADNAIYHSEKGSAVRVTLKADGAQAVLSVINRGEPIPEGDEEKIFERFYRGDKARSRGENRYGLGLAIAKNIVERHGGKISAHSENGETTFMVVI